MSTIRIETILQQDKLDEDIKNSVILHNNEAYTFFDSGLTRHVFVNKDKTKVIKILINFNFKDYNLEEYELYQNASDDTKKELASTSIFGFIIEQEFCNPIKLDKRKLTISQILFADSCRNEVGWSKDGRLVCFDLDEYKRY